VAGSCGSYFATFNRQPDGQEKQTSVGFPLKALKSAATVAIFCDSLYATLPHK